MLEPIKLPLLSLRFQLEGDGPLHLADLAGAVRMRGAFGLFFRRLVCPPYWWTLDCRSCRLWRTCAYPNFFMPAPPPGADRLRQNADVPRPYVFRSAEADMEFEMTFVGRGCEALPFAIVAVQQLGEEGFGRTRQRYRLHRVTTLEPSPRLVFDAASPVVHNVAQTAPRTGERQDRLAGRRTYRFLTPTILKAGGSVEAVPRYSTLVKRARDRVNALSTFYGAGPLDWSFREIGEKAEKIGIAAVAGGRLRHGRFSGRQHQLHDLSGFVGELTYEGPEEVFSELDPLLSLLDEIHVGKAAALGNGRVKEAAAAPVSG